MLSVLNVIERKTIVGLFNYELPITNYHLDRGRQFRSEETRNY